jgi:hypothetical protein
MTWKGFEMKRPWPQLRHYPIFWLEEMRKTMEELNRYKWSPSHIEPGHNAAFSAVPIGM